MIKINKWAGRWQSFIIGTVGLIGAWVTGGNEGVFAQVIPDDTLGAESSVVNPDAIIRDILSNRIEGGATRGANLFHSFIEFNVAEGRGIYFANPDGIENILSRVTGGNVSTILGRLGVLGEANLFLLNPNGILFGENASLDIEGSFVATTASGIELGEDGVFSATEPKSSRLLSVSPGALFYNAVEAAGGKITNRGNLTTGRNLTLDGENLDLQGQLRSGSDLTLFAQDTVKVRDSVATPFLAQAGGNLTIQGNGGIDIWALNHPTQTPFVSEGDLNLRSDGIISGDARFASGGSFLISRVSGGLANFVSLNDPIISATGNVDVAANYTGASLLVEATGNIRFGGDINITGPDTSALPDGPDTETLRTSSALIMRSGQDTLAYGGVNYGSVPHSTTDVPEGITIGGDVVLQPSNGVGGIVDLEAASGDVNTQGIITNGGAINIYSAGGITTNGQTLDSRNGVNDGGDIRLEASNGSIFTGMLRSNSSSFFQAGNGGGIRLESSDRIHIRGSLFSSSWSFFGNAGHGGDINISATNDITITENLSASSISFNGTSNGGKISIFTANGSISVGSLRSNSYSFVTGGNGGDINLSAAKDITTGGLFSEAGGAGNGGNVTLTSTAGGIDTTRGDVISQIRDNSGGTGNAGTIIFTAEGDIRTATLNASAESGNGSLIQITSTNGTIDATRGVLATDSRSGNAGEVKLNAFDNITTGRINSLSRGSGNGGAISIITTSGNISTNTLNSRSRSVSSGNTGNGGTIRIESGDGIHIRGSLFSDSWSNSGNAGNGGDISLSAANDITIDDHAYAYSLSFDGTAANGGTISLVSANGNVSTGSLSSDSRSDSESAANGGAINISATNGSISSTGYLLSGSSSGFGVGGNGGAITLEAANDITIARDVNAQSNSRYGNAGNGGAIRLQAGNDINIADSVNSFSSSESGNAGNGGEISLIARNGDILGDSSNLILYSFTVSEAGEAGSGGKVTLEAQNIINLDILTLSSSDEAGDVEIKGFGDLSVTNTRILTSRRVEQELPFFDKVVVLDVSVEGQSGDVTITSSGNLTFNDSSIESDTNGSGKAGNVTLSSPGLVTLNSSQIISDTSNIGDAGDIAINAGGGIIFQSLYSSEGESQRSRLFAGTTNSGNAGTITLTTPELTLQDEANIATTTENSGTAGTITLQSHPNQENLNINLEEDTSISASTSNEGTGGNLRIIAPDSVTIQGQGTITTETTDAGKAGNIEITSTNLDIQQTQLSTSTTATGNAGNITLDTSTLTIARGAEIFALTEGSGDSGTITVNASTAVNLGIGVNDFSPVLSVETSNAGKAGNIIINTPSLTLSDTARITATATNTATNTEGGGSITLNASTMDLAGIVGVFAETQGQTPAGTLTLKPYQDQSTLNLTLAPQSRISASTSGSGKGGNLEVSAPEAITIRGQGELAVETTGDGAAGNLTIDTQRLTIADGAAISASTSSANPSGVGGNLIINATESFHLTNQASLLAQSTGAAKAGNVTINTEQLTADNGSITTSATATSLGEGGSIDVNASQINLKGTEIGLLAETEGVAPAGALTLQPFENGQNLTINLQDNAKISAATSGSGEGGSLSVTAPEAITIRGQGELSVETTGDGAAGNLTIDTKNLTITDGATISASTASANPSGLGGNLTINATESFTLTNQARLLAQSTGAAPAGTITVDTGQLTANNGSIETSATQSAGGAITITASDIRLFGDSDIRTDVASGVGGGGNITLTADSILAFADSDILAFAQDGKGGDITFNTPVFFGFAYAPAPKGTDPDTLDHNDRVDINASGAIEGVITLPDDSAVRNSLTPLSNNQIDTDKLIAESCIARRHEPQRGSFFITGTGGIPFRPGDLYDTPYQTGTVRSIPSEGDGEAGGAGEAGEAGGESSSSTRRPWKIGDPIIEPTGIYRLPNGKVIMSRLCGE